MSRRAIHRSGTRTYANPLHDWPRSLWSGERESASERIRTSDLRFRRLLREAQSRFAIATVRSRKDRGKGAPRLASRRFAQARRQLCPNADTVEKPVWEGSPKRRGPFTGADRHLTLLWGYGSNADATCTRRDREAARHWWCSRERLLAHDGHQRNKTMPGNRPLCLRK